MPIIETSLLKEPVTITIHFANEVDRDLWWCMWLDGGGEYAMAEGLSDHDANHTIPDWDTKTYTLTYKDMKAPKEE